MQYFDVSKLKSAQNRKNRESWQLQQKKWIPLLLIETRQNVYVANCVYYELLSESLFICFGMTLAACDYIWIN